METLLIIDKGCIVGLECSNNSLGNINYDNTFIVTEPNTIIYRINLKKFEINKEEKINLINFLKILYKKQCKLIENYKNIKKDLLSKKEIYTNNNIINNYKKTRFIKEKEFNYFNNNSHNNNFPIKRKSINISYNHKRLSLSNDKQEILCNSDTFNRNSKYKLQKRNIDNYKFITPFIICNNKNNKFKNQNNNNPINLKNYNNFIMNNNYGLQQKILTNFSSNDSHFLNLDYKNKKFNINEINKLRDSSSKTKKK